MRPEAIVPPEREGLREPRAPSRNRSHTNPLASDPKAHDVERHFAPLGSPLRRDSYPKSESMNRAICDVRFMPLETASKQHLSKVHAGAPTLHKRVDRKSSNV